MDKKLLKAGAAVWQSRQEQLRYETDGFTLPLSGLSRRDLLGLLWVTEEDLAFSQMMLSAVRPARRADLKKTIAYMAELHERQQEAFASESAWIDDQMTRMGVKLEQLRHERQQPT